MKITFKNIRRSKQELKSFTQKALCSLVTLSFVSQTLFYPLQAQAKITASTSSSIQFQASGDSSSSQEFGSSNTGISEPGLPEIFQNEPRANQKLPRIVSHNIFPDQVHRVYEARIVNGQIINEVKAEYSLSDINTANPYVNVLDFSKEIRFRYDDKAQELLIERVQFDSYLKGPRVTDAHVIKGVKIESNVAVDPSIGFFATESGVHAFLMRSLKTAFCNKILVSPVVLPRSAQAGVQIKQIDLMTQAIAPTQFVNAPESIEDGDLGIHFSNGEKHLVKRTEPILNLGNQLLGVLAQVQALNPDVDQFKAYQNVFKQNQVALAQYFEAQRKLVDGSRNDLVAHALRSYGQKLDYNELGLLFEKDSKSQNQFEALAQAPRNAFSAKTTPDSKWAQNHQAIQNGQQADRDAIQNEQDPELKAKLKVRSWRQILVDQMTGASKDKVQQTVKAEKSFIKKSISTIIDAYEKHATKRNLGIVAISVGLLATDRYISREPMDALFAMITQMLNSTTEVPVLGSVVQTTASAFKPMTKAIDYLRDPQQSWAALRLAIGTAFILTFNPVSYFIANLNAIRDSKSWGKVQAFFTYGTRMYGIINFPFQKFLLWDRARQKGLYEMVLDSKVNPFKFRQVFNVPWASKEKLEAKYAKVDAALVADAEIKGRSMLLAAAIVSQASAKSATPIDVASLLVLSEEYSAQSLAGQQAQNIEELFLQAVQNEKFADLNQKIYSSLVGMGDKGGAIDQSEVYKYVEIFNKYYNQFKNDSSGGFKQAVRSLYRTSVNMMSKNILPFALFGMQWYSAYRKYRHIEINNESAEIAAVNYDEDYKMSAIYYAGIAPQKFGQIPLLGIGAPEVITNQLSQVFIYGVQGAVDTPDPKEGLANPYTPLSNDIYAEKRKREQTPGESLGSLAQAVVDPSTPSLFGQHATVIKNIVEGYQIRYAADFFTRTLALGFTQHMNGTYTNFYDLIVRSSMLTAAFVIAKLSFQWAPGAGFISGYATCWPYIKMGMRLMKDSTNYNLSMIQSSDYMIATGLEIGDLKLAQRGVETLKELYAEDKHKLPSEFNIPTASFNYDLIQRFHNYSLDNVPRPTDVSHSLKEKMSLGGAIFSTIIFDSISGVVMNPKTDAKLMLIETTAWFALSFVALTAVSKVTPKILTAGHKVAEVVKPVVDNKLTRPFIGLGKATVSKTFSAVSKLASLVGGALGFTVDAVGSATKTVIEAPVKVAVGTTKAATGVYKKATCRALFEPEVILTPDSH